MGFEGQKITADASLSAWLTLSVGRALSMPSKLTPVTVSLWRRRTKYSWKSNVPSAVSMRVCTGSSHIGKMRDGMASDPANSEVASVRVSPCKSICVRKTWVIMSMSPMRNQASRP
jgi:hypothetical protein